MEKYEIDTYSPYNIKGNPVREYLDRNKEKDIETPQEEKKYKNIRIDEPPINFFNMIRSFEFRRKTYIFFLENNNDFINEFELRKKIILLIIGHEDKIKHFNEALTANNKAIFTEHIKNILYG